MRWCSISRKPHICNTKQVSAGKVKLILLLYTHIRLQGRNINNTTGWDAVTNSLINATVSCQSGISFCVLFTIENSVTNGESLVLVLQHYIHVCHCYSFTIQILALLHRAVTMLPVLQLAHPAIIVLVLKVLLAQHVLRLITVYPTLVSTPEFASMGLAMLPVYVQQILFLHIALVLMIETLDPVY